MKKIFLLLFIFVFILSESDARCKIVAETSQPLQQFTIIRGETGKIDTYQAWRKDKKSFLIESNNLTKDSIFLQGSIVLRLYETGTKKVTKWIKLSERKKISLAECFDKYIDKTIDFKNFIVPNYLSATLSSDKDNLRNNPSETTVFNESYQEFASPSEVSFYWKSPLENAETEIIDLISQQKLSQFKVGQDTKFDLKSVRQEIEFDYNRLYVFRLHYTDGLKEMSDSVIFKLCPIVISNRHKNIFYTSDSIAFQWNTELSNLKVSIKNGSKTLWKHKKYKKNNLSLNDIENCNLLPNQIYVLKIEGEHNREKTVTEIKFVVLLNSIEAKVLDDFMRN